MRLPSLNSFTPFGRKLQWVLLGLALALAPHVSHFPAWVTLLCATTALYRLIIDFRQSELPPKWLRILVALGGSLAVLMTYRTLNGVEAGTALLALMAGFKLLETQSVRDLTVIVFLSYFSLFAAFLYSQSLLQLPYMLLAAWLLTATLMRIHQTTLSMPSREAMILTGKMFMQALPLAILLFLFFPRLPGQFWAIPARGQASTGIDDEMSPGDVSDLSISGAIAFRVHFEGQLPPPEERYWRGPVLHDFDGRTWRRARALFLSQTIKAQGGDYRYRLTMEPTQRHWVFPLDVAVHWKGPTAIRTADNMILTRDPITTLTTFAIQSSTHYSIEGDLPRAMLSADLMLPEHRNPRSIALARELRARAGSDEAFIQSVLSKFRREQYFYTLEPPRLQTDAVDDFLFTTKRGFCEHFASAFTLLARAAGIPARVVTGYQGGEFNPMGNYLIVRQSDAHAWSEVWLAGKGWVRVDPTAAVAPERIERGMDAAIPASEAVPGRLLRQNALFSQLRLMWDAANTFWNDQVVDFGNAQQQWLMSWFGADDADWRTLGTALVATFLLFFAAMSAYLAWRFRGKRREPLAQIYAQLCRKLARHGLAREPHEGPNDYLHRIANSRPDLATAIDEMRALYVSLRYGPNALPGQLSRLKFLVNQLKV
jgi:transglutaminase-like putative cysteine protease